MSGQNIIKREVERLIHMAANNGGGKEQGGNPRPADWPAPSQEDMDRITKGVPAPPTQPKS